MITTKGRKLKRLPLELNKFVGDLMSIEFPLTTIFSDSNNEPIVRDWIDSHEHVNTFVYFKTTKSLLKSFIDGRIEQSAFIKQSTDGLLYVTDEIGGEILEVKAISSKELPKEYLSENKFFFDTEIGYQYKEIAGHFELDKITL